MDLNVKVNVPLVEQLVPLVEQLCGDLLRPSAKVIGDNLAKMFQSIPVAGLYLFNCSKKVLEIL